MFSGSFSFYIFYVPICYISTSFIGNHILHQQLQLFLIFPKSSASVLVLSHIGKLKPIGAYKVLGLSTYCQLVLHWMLKFHHGIRAIIQTYSTSPVLSSTHIWLESHSWVLWASFLVWSVIPHCKIKPLHKRLWYGPIHPFPIGFGVDA